MTLLGGVIRDKVSWWTVLLPRSSSLNDHHREWPPAATATYLVGAADWSCGGAVVVSGSAAWVVVAVVVAVVYSIDILLVIREATSTYLEPFVVIPVCRRRTAYYKWDRHLLLTQCCIVHHRISLVSLTSKSLPVFSTISNINFIV
jgi:hypothetical protein